MSQIRKLPQRLLHGGDYNPAQWLDQPQILEEDIRLMKEAHVNVVSLGIFAWARLEPFEGVYDIDWLKQIIDRLYENGIYTILATPTAAVPHWMSEKYEEVRMVLANKIRKLPGGFLEQYLHGLGADSRAVAHRREQLTRSEA